MSPNDSNDQSTLQSLISSSQGAMDRIYPAQKRANLQSKINDYALHNPKLSALIFINILFTGPPILLFILYSLTIFLFSFSAVLITTFIVASLFTASMVGVALLVLVPTVFVTTVAAVIMFTWGLLAYWVFEWSKKTTTTTVAERRGQVQRPQQVDHGQGQQNHSRRLQAGRQQPGENTFGYDKKGSRSEPDRRENEDQNEENDDGSEQTYTLDDSGKSDGVNMPYDKKEADEKHGYYKPEGAASGHLTKPVNDGDEVFNQPVHAQNSAKQADYKAYIAENGAYVEAAPGLNTVHSIAISG